MEGKLDFDLKPLYIDWIDVVQTFRSAMHDHYEERGDEAI